MFLNYIIEGSHSSAREHMLLAMRQIMLTGKYAPMNVDLFYDQFLDVSKLNEFGKQVVGMSKRAWSEEFRHFTCFLDYGVDEYTQPILNQIHDRGYTKVDLAFLSEVSERFNVASFSHSIDEYVKATSEDPKLVELSSKLADKVIADSPLHEHLPQHFDTYFDNSLYSREGDVPERVSRVIFESPFQGDIANNTQYAARAIVELMLTQQKAPMASHLLYTRMLNDLVPEERMIGIDAGLEYGRHAEETVIAVDRGLSTGMKYGIANANNADRDLSFLTLSSDDNVKREVASLRDEKDLSSWVTERENKVSPELKSVGWLIEPPEALNKDYAIEHNLDIPKIR